MAPEKIEDVQVDPRTGYEQSVVEYRPSTQDVLANRLSRLVLLIGGVIVILLLMRIVFVALGANPDNQFAELIYHITDVLVAPFAGILNYQNVGRAALDVPAVVALIVYAIVAAIIARLLRLLLMGSGHVRSVKRVQRLP